MAVLSRLIKSVSVMPVMLGAIPLGLIVALANIFKVPAVLKPIPEGYVPQEYEYHKSPVTRWLVKHIYPSMQEMYEHMLSKQWEESKKQNMYLLSKEVKRQMRVHSDYKGWFTQEVSAEYLRMAMYANKKHLEGRGYNHSDD